MNGDSKCGRWTKEKCQKVQEKQVCCLKKDTREKEEASKVTTVAPIELATVHCDGFTPHFCDILEFLGISNSTCCSVGHFDAVPLEDLATCHHVELPLNSSDTQSFPPR